MPCIVINEAISLVENFKLLMNMQVKIFTQSYKITGLHSGMRDVLSKISHRREAIPEAYFGLSNVMYIYALYNDILHFPLACFMVFCKHKNIKRWSIYHAFNLRRRLALHSHP